ncbi:MAG: alpha/beta hydrolase, partial [Alphaproteobacteria bacterium]|nr:alpha/beta hydrolase [Alphaproteobacteria bacterium]
MDRDALFGCHAHHGLRAIAGHLLVAHLGPHVAILGRIIPGQRVMDQPCPAAYLTAMTMKPFITSRRALMAALALAGCAEARAPMGPVVTRPAVLDDALVMADGLRLPLHVWRPDGPPRAVMLALHGMNEYGRSFAEDAAPWFAAAGVALYAYDQRGFGGTAPRGVWPGHETLAQDAITAAGLMRARYPGLPLFMLGESMGGAVLVLAGSKAPMADGLVLSAPALRGRASLGWQARWTLDVMVALTPGLAVSS